MFERLVAANFDVAIRNHAGAILTVDFPDIAKELEDALMEVSIPAEELIGSGGGEAASTQRLRKRLYQAGWPKHNFDFKLYVDGRETVSNSHEIDHVRRTDGGTIALEIEWNNKDPFYDRDLNNFRLLFDLRAVSVGVIITRCDHLQDIFDELGRGSSFGASTTHMSKLLPRIHGGSGGGCPLLVFGISRALYQED